MDPNTSNYLLPKESVKYQKYEAYCKFVWRYRVLLAALALLLAVLAVLFVSNIGHMSGTVLSGSVMYGESPAHSVRAFCASVRFQYTQNDPSVWRELQPTAPGTYSVRAVTNNVLGQPQFSDTAIVALTPRPVTITITADAYDYGSTELQSTVAYRAEGLAKGDYVAEIMYTFTEQADKSYEVSLNSLRIENEAGENVTSNYTVTSKNGVLALQKREIAVTVNNAEKTYDGLPWNRGKATITNGTLLNGDTLHTTFDKVFVDAGTYALRPVCTVTDRNGKDVTAYYHIQINEGQLNIEPIPITVRTESAQKVFDGEPLTEKKWEILQGTVLEGHVLHGDVTGSQRRMGSSENKIKLTVTAEDGTNVTKNYRFEVQTGTLRVDPIVLYFETDGGEKVYDGNVLYVHTFRQTGGKALSGHHVSAYIVGNQINVGTSPNTLQVSVWSADGQDVTADGYKIEVKEGQLTVTPRPITITSDSAEKLYDGKPLRCESFRITSGSLASQYQKDGVRASDFTGEQTKVGSSSNTFSVTISDQDGRYNNGNYTITYQFGTLTVHENPNPPTSSDSSGLPNPPNQPNDESIYNPSDSILWRDQKIQIGFPSVTKKTVAYAELVSGKETNERVYFRDTSYGEYTVTGWAPPNIYYKEEFQSPLKYVGSALRAEGKLVSMIRVDRTNNCPPIVPCYGVDYAAIAEWPNDTRFESAPLSYEMPFYIGFTYGTLKNKKVATENIDRERAYREFVYAEYLSLPASTKKAVLEWANAYGISAQSPTLVEDIQQAVMNAGSYNLNGKQYPAGVDVAVYFLTKAKEGVCQHFATAATVLYRAFGIPARYTVGYATTLQKGKVTEITTLDGHAWVEVYVDALGWVAVDVTGSAFSDSPPSEQKLYVEAANVVKYYDGKPYQTEDLQCTVTAGTLKAGHSIKAEVTPRQNMIYPGQYECKISKCTVYDEFGRDVTDEYNLTLTHGTVTILPRKITVQMGSALKEYDGLPLTESEYWIAAGSLAAGHTLSLTPHGSITEVGFVENEAQNVQIFANLPNGAQQEVTGCYDITVLSGVLEVIDKVPVGEEWF